jgi:hypothetical protein
VLLSLSHFLDDMPSNNTPPCIDMLFDIGLLTRLCQLCDGNNNSIKSHSLKLLCCMFDRCDNFRKHIMLQLKYNIVNKYCIHELRNYFNLILHNNSSHNDNNNIQYGNIIISNTSRNMFESDDNISDKHINNEVCTIHFYSISL